MLSNGRRVVIQSALPVEYSAIRHHMTSAAECTHPKGTVYESGQFRCSDGGLWEVLLVEVGAGNPRSALEAERAIEFFNPSVCMFVGVAGGVKDVTLGDVVAASKVYGYECGKTADTFAPRPNVGECSHALVQRAMAEAKKSNWLLRLPAECQLDAPPRAVVGAIAAGEKVLATTQDELFEFLRQNYSDTLAVEMEGRGFLAAVHANADVQALVIRGISDLIDSKAKSDSEGYQKHASATASAFAFEVLDQLESGKTTSEEEGQLLIHELEIEGRKRQEISTARKAQISVPVKLPYASLGTLFQGREDELADLSRKMDQERRKDSTTVSGIVIHGLGGIGKSRLAVEFSWRYVNTFSAVFLVTADTHNDIVRSIATLAEPLTLNLPEQKSDEQSVRFAAVVNWMRRHPDWLLILDGVDTEDAAKGVEETLSLLTGGHCIVTGRLDRWSKSLDCLELSVLDIDDSAQLLQDRTTRRRRKSESDADYAVQIAKELDGLALALEQAGAFIDQRRISFSDYLDRWKRHDWTVQQWHDQRLMKYPRSVATTWDITMNQLQPSERAFLYLFAWFGPDPIPVLVAQDIDVWKKATVLTEGRTDGKSPECAYDVGDALCNLADFSMLRLDGETETLSIHRVVQEIVRNQLANVSRSEWVVLAALLLISAGDGDINDPTHTQRMSQIRPHCIHILGFEEAQIDSNIHWNLLSLIAVTLRVEGLYKDAVEWHHRSLALAESEFSNKDSRVAGSLINLAESLMELSRFEEAEQHLQRAATIAEGSDEFGEEQLQTILGDLAVTIYEQGNLKLAEKKMRTALKEATNSKGEMDPSVGVWASNLAILLADTERSAEADDLFQKSIRIFEVNYDGKSPRLATALSNYAGLKLSQNEFSQAEDLHRQALAIEKNAFGQDHPCISRRLVHVAKTIIPQGRISKAKALLDQAMPRIELAYGADSVAYANALLEYSQVLQAEGNHLEEETCLRKSRLIFGKYLGETHPVTAVAANSLAYCVFQQGDRDGGLSILRRALENAIAMSDASGFTHVDCKTFATNYAGMLLEVGKSPVEIEEHLQDLGLRGYIQLLEGDKETSEGRSSIDTAIKVGRNDPCPCGSGRKFKKCCLKKE